MKQLLENELEINIFHMVNENENNYNYAFFILENTNYLDYFKRNSKFSYRNLANTSYLFISLNNFLTLYKKEKFKSIQQKSFQNSLLDASFFKNNSEDEDKNKDTFYYNIFSNNSLNNEIFYYNLPIYNFFIEDEKEFKIGSLYIIFKEDGLIEEHFSIISKNKENGLVYSLSDKYPFNKSILDVNELDITDLNNYFNNKVKNKQLKDSILDLNEIINNIIFNKKPFLDREVINSNDKSFINFIYKKFSFLEKYINNENKYELINYVLLNHIFLPYIRHLTAQEINVFDFNKQLNEELINYLLKESNYVKQLQKIIPKANKKTFTLINEITQNNKKDNYELFNNTYKFDYLFFNVFETSELLNEFLSNVEIISDSNSNQKSKINYILNDADSLYYFLNHELVKLFTSKRKMENILISSLKNKKENEDNFIKEQSELTECVCYKNCECYPDCDCDFDEEDCDCDIDCQCDCECGFEHGYFAREIAFEGLLDDLNEIKKIYYNLKELKNDLLNDSFKNKEKLALIESTLNEKFFSLKEIHDELSVLYTNLVDEKEIFESVNFKVTNSNEYSLEEILNSISLKEIGIKMNHCVATYKNSILKNNKSIFIIKNKINQKFEICLEYDRFSNSIVQAKGNYNEIVRERDILNLIKEFCKINKINITTNDLYSIRTNH